MLTQRRHSSTNRFLITIISTLRRNPLMLSQVTNNTHMTLTHFSRINKVSTQHLQRRNTTRIKTHNIRQRHRHQSRQTAQRTLRRTQITSNQRRRILITSPTNNNRGFSNFRSHVRIIYQFTRTRRRSLTRQTPTPHRRRLHRRLNATSLTPRTLTTNRTRRTTSNTTRLQKSTRTLTKRRRTFRHLPINRTRRRTRQTISTNILKLRTNRPIRLTFRHQRHHSRHNKVKLKLSIPNNRQLTIHPHTRRSLNISKPSVRYTRTLTRNIRIRKTQ